MATNQINRNKIQYEGLQKRLEIVNSEYEDVSKSDVIKEDAYNDGIESMWDKLQNADTIIEADKESDNNDT